MRISVLDAQHTIFEGSVAMATLPGLDGELSLMDDHESIFVALTKGYIRLEAMAQKVTGTPEEIKPILIHQGIARMKNNELVVLVE